MRLSTEVQHVISGNILLCAETCTYANVSSITLEIIQTSDQPIFFLMLALWIFVVALCIPETVIL